MLLTIRHPVVPKSVYDWVAWDLAGEAPLELPGAYCWVRSPERRYGLAFADSAEGLTVVWVDLKTGRELGRFAWQYRYGVPNPGR